MSNMPILSTRNQVYVQRSCGPSALHVIVRKLKYTFSGKHEGLAWPLLTQQAENLLLSDAPL